jgi:uncharacterized protein YdhG (YjbR/CyaY superfamily)
MKVDHEEMMAKMGAEIKTDLRTVQEKTEWNQEMLEAKINACL